MPFFRKQRPESQSRLKSAPLGAMGQANGLAMGGVAMGLAMGLSIAGCDERVLDHGLTYQHAKGELFGFEPVPEPPPSPIRRMSGVNPDYPPLSTVPMRPPLPATPAERKAAMDALAADRAAGRLADTALKEVAPPPLPVPPAPAGVGPTKVKAGKAKAEAKAGDSVQTPAR